MHPLAGPLGKWEADAWTGTPVRVAGDDRYASAIAVSRRSFPATAAAVVLATGRAFPDALAAGPLAHAYGGPVLLVPPTGLTPEITAEISRLRPADIFVVGSSASVTESVVPVLEGLAFGPRVERLAGPNRFGTAGEVARKLKRKLGAIEQVAIVTGADFPDALSVAPLAASHGWPILLTRPAVLSTETADALIDVVPSSALVIGDERAVGPCVFAALPSPTRIQGTDRFATCAAVAQYALSRGHSFAYAALVRADSFPDAVVVGPLVASRSGLLVLVGKTGTSAGLTSLIAGERATIRAIDVFGGTGSLPDYAVSRLLTRL